MLGEVEAEVSREGEYEEPSEELWQRLVQIHQGISGSGRYNKVVFGWRFRKF